MPNAVAIRPVFTGKKAVYGKIYADKTFAKQRICHENHI